MLLVLDKNLLNGKKVPCIPPVYDNNRYVTDFKEKCQLFNSYFSEQCTLLKNICTLPNTCSKHTNNILDTIVFSKEDIYKIIKNLDPNKTHGHDMISIRMIKLCGISICKPLEIIFQNCLRSGNFPSEWKKANVVPTFKKGDKQCIKNYRPVFLLPVCGKVFERLLYNKMFSFFSENNLIKFYSTRSSQIDNISNIKTRSNFFRNSFFPSTITEWNKLDCDIRNRVSLNIFKLLLLKFVRPVANSIFDINNPYGLKLLTRLRLGLSHLRYHKFRHNFQDCINPMCDCDLETETTTHFLLHCPLFQSARQSLLMIIKKIDESILKKHDELITKALLYGDDKFDLSCNKSIISSTIEFIVSTGRFSNSLV